MTIRRLQHHKTTLYKHLRLIVLQATPYIFSSTYPDTLQRSDQGRQHKQKDSLKGAIGRLSDAPAQPNSSTHSTPLGRLSAAGVFLHQWSLHNTYA